MALQVDADPVLAGPARQRQRQRGQQDVVDAGAIGGGGRPQQRRRCPARRSSPVTVTVRDRRRRGSRCPWSGAAARATGSGRASSAVPSTGSSWSRPPSATWAGQAAGPSPGTRWSGRRGRRLAPRQPAGRRCPGRPAGCARTPRRSTRWWATRRRNGGAVGAAGEQRGPQQRALPMSKPACRSSAAFSMAASASSGGQPGQVVPGEDGSAVRAVGGFVLPPVAAVLGEPHAQRVVVVQQGGQRLLQRRRVGVRSSSSSADWLKWWWLAGAWRRTTRWMGVSGRSPVTGAAVGPVRPGGDATVARAATVWWVNRSLVASRSPAWRARETTWMLRIESPPRSKKLSSRADPVEAEDVGPDLRRSGVSVGGARRDVRSAPGAGAGSGSGRARRSTLPFGVSGSSRQGDEHRRHHVRRQEPGPGSRAAPRRRSAAAACPRPGRRSATRRFGPAGVPARGPYDGHRGLATSGLRRSALSISPGSMRKPRTLTWSSARPTNRSSPSASSAPGRPVRYIRLARPAPNGSATKRAAVSPGRPR